MLAAIRPTGWDFPLFLHVLGAMILVGGLVVAVAMQLLAWRRRDPADAALPSPCEPRPFAFAGFSWPRPKAFPPFEFPCPAFWRATEEASRSAEGERSIGRAGAPVT